ncbi:MAG: IS1595 family transposase [Caldilineaceae bacterium]|nr:IS1595 family transposase [Caldilineaceae bacterium]
MTSPKAPGKAFRKGITLMELAEMFPDEESAQRWFEERFWPNGRCCGHCGSTNTKEASHAKMPYWCTDCRSYFSIKTGTLLEYTQLPLRKWVFAIYLHVTSLKGISSMKLHRDIGVAQKTAWHMLQRIRKAFDDSGPFDGPVDVDESYFGGKRANMSNAQRKEQTRTRHRRQDGCGWHQGSGHQSGTRPSR